MKFLLYGAYGYTGELIIRYAKEYGLEPILAGRREEALKPLSELFGYSYKVIDIDDGTALRSALKEVKVVIHAAGPFQFTAKQMVEACLDTNVHYLDINGDIAVFEMLKKYDEKGKEKNVMIMPGVGFDVVPTDCTALLLKKLLPDAIDLQLAFATLGGAISHGTAMTMANRLGGPGARRKNGKIIPSPLGRKGMWIDFGVKKLFVMSIPWGDVSTAHFTTGIPDIETFTGISPNTYRILKLQPAFNWLLRTNFIRNFIKKKINQRPAGPSDEMRKYATSLVWGQVTNPAGRIATARLKCPEGYTLTAHSSLIIAKKVLNGIYLPGYRTPANVYGSDLVLEVPGVERIQG